jgi:hypothetical protein
MEAVILSESPILFRSVRLIRINQSRFPDRYEVPVGFEYKNPSRIYEKDFYI